MPDSDFPSGQQMLTTEVDQDSPLTDLLMNKFRDRDITLMDRGAIFGGTGADGDVTATADPTVWGIDLATTTTAGPGTLSSSGTTVTISTTSGVNALNYIRLVAGPQSGQYRKVISITSTTVFEIETAFSADQTTIPWEKKAPKGIQNYNNFTTNASVILTGLPDIPIIIFAKTSITINYHIEVSGMGRPGGVAVGNATPGLPGSGGISAGGGGGGATGPYNGGDGGDGVLHGEVLSSGGAGGVGSSGVGSNGNGITIMMENSIAMGGIMLGGGGGGGSAGGGSATGRNGGRGGGTIYLESPSVTLNAQSFLRVEGNNGGNGTPDAGSGGGGGGGTIVIKAKTLVNNGSMTASAGAGGIGGNAGGAGGIGLIYIFDY